MSPVTYQISPITCHLSPVTKANSLGYRSGLCWFWISGWFTKTEPKNQNLILKLEFSQISFVCLSRIDQAERFVGFAWARLIRLGRGAWFAWLGWIRLRELPDLHEQDFWSCSENKVEEYTCSTSRLCILQFTHDRFSSIWLNMCSLAVTHPSTNTFPAL